jgi:hypothetical protein
MRGYYDEMQIRSERLLSPDKAYGCIAWNNRAKICNFDPIDNSSTVIVSESAALWGGRGLDIYQRSHADGESGQFNIVEPLTNGYVVRVWPQVSNYQGCANECNCRISAQRTPQRFYVVQTAKMTF